MRVVVEIHHPIAPKDRSHPAPMVVEFESEHAKCHEPERDRTAQKEVSVVSESSAAARAEVVSFFLGGPHDEQVRRAIPEGELIVEDPAFDAIGFYGLAGIDRGGGVVAQWYRWISIDETDT